ncbi:MAG: peptidase [Erysipelotrichaceae bacterium]|nr:peptidase [Erysipelotrichaceae bacterium]
MYKIGDYVTRKKYNHDIIFKIVEKKDDLFILKGEYVRLMADAYEEDLSVAYKQDEKLVLAEELRLNDDLVRGNILHIDGDKNYLERCLKVYKNKNIPAIGIYMKEEDLPKNITNLLVKYNPDVLVITGHDKVREFNGKKEYLNSKYFIDAVKKARVYQPNKDSLIIFAGACQSFYEGIIESGANFSSGIDKNNINVLDPCYIAIQAANTHVLEYLNIKKVLENTVSKGRGLGGIDTKGVARKIYIG